jgi:hypothetical protein
MSQTFIQRYHAQSSDLRPAAERDLETQRDNLKQLRVATLKALDEKHADEIAAVEKTFNDQFDKLNGRGPR